MSEITSAMVAEAVAAVLMTIVDDGKHPVGVKNDVTLDDVEYTGGSKVMSVMLSNGQLFEISVARVY